MDCAASATIMPSMAEVAATSMVGVIMVISRIRSPVLGSMRTPSGPITYPASSRICLASSGSYGYVSTSGL